MNTREKGAVMFHKRKEPDKPFGHGPDCKIVAADPGVNIGWSEIRSGVWEAVSVCGKQYFYDPLADDRVRLDPLDPKTARHAGYCGFIGETDAAMLRAVLRVTPKDGYDWVECNACGFGWQVPHFESAESVG